MTKKSPKPDALYVTAGRGLRQFVPITCTYNSTVKVYESSSAQAPHVWVEVISDPKVMSKQPKGDGVAHLNMEQVDRLVTQLSTWLAWQKKVVGK